MSRWKQLEEIEERLHYMSAEELRAAVEMWREQHQTLRSPALKQSKKLLHRLERALEPKSSSEELEMS